MGNIRFSLNNISSFIFSIYMVVVAKVSYDPKCKMAANPIHCSKAFKHFFSRNTIFLQKASGDSANINSLNLFGQIYNRPLVGWGKLGKITQKFKYMNSMS